jgi:hypothetical protein
LGKVNFSDIFLHNFLRRQRRVGILGWRPVKRRQPVLGVGDEPAIWPDG